VSMGAAAVALLATRSLGTPWAFRGIRERLQRAIRAHGLPNRRAALSGGNRHDLRRTCASGMARLGVHLSVNREDPEPHEWSFGGVVGIYQRHSFSEEERAALDTWSRFIMHLVSGGSPRNGGRT